MGERERVARWLLAREPPYAPGGMATSKRKVVRHGYLDGIIYILFGCDSGYDLRT